MAVSVLFVSACVEHGPPPTTSSTTGSTDTSDPTDTTEPGDASSSSSTTDTTDPTDPTDPPEDTEPEFAFDEPVVMFTDEGGSVDVQLVEYDGGEETDTEVPDEVTYEILGDVDAFDVEDLDDGGLRISSDGTVGGIVIAARLPGQPLATVTEIFTAVPNEGVDVIDTSRVVFPPASLPHGMKLADYRDGAGLVTGSVVGPFTWQELVDRVSIPEGVDITSEPDPGAALDPDPIETPFVIRGTAPADGTLVLSGGANGMSGRVIASITRMHDGAAYSLLTVQVASMDDLYADLSWNPDEFDVDLVTSDMTEEELDIATLDRESPLVRAGVIPQSYGFELSCADPGVSVSDCENDDLVDHPTMTVVATDGTTGDFGRSASAGTSRVESRQGPTSTVVDDGSGGSGQPVAEGEENKTKCGPEISAAVKDLSGPKPVHKIYPKPVFSIFLSDKPEDWAKEHFYMTNGYVQSSSFEFSGTLRASLSASVGCSKVLGFIPVPIPMGPMTGILMFGVQAQAILDVGVAIEGGPSLEMGLKCSMSHRLSVGFKASTAPGGQRLRNIDPIVVNTLDRGCTPRWDTKLGINNQGIAAKVDMSAYVGFKFLLGFKVNEFLGVGLWAEILDFPNKGFFDLASIDAGPKAILTVETPARVLDNDASETRAAIDVKVTGKIGSSAIERIANGVGLKSSDITSSFQTTFLDLTLPVIALYEPINAVPNGIQVTVDGESQSGTAKARKGQRIGVRSLMAAAGPALNQEIRDAELYVVKNLPLGFEVIYDKLDGVRLTGNTMSIDDEFTLTEAHCDLIGTDPVDVVILANGIVFRAGGLEMDAASYGGRFSIRCMQPELKFSADRVDFESDQVDTTKSIDLKATMLGGETWTVTDKPAWLNLSPTTGTPPADRDESTIGMGLGVECPTGDSNKYNGTVTVSANVPGNTGTVTGSFAVSADCRRVYLDASPKHFDVGPGGGDVTVQLSSDGPHPVYVGRAPGGVNAEGEFLFMAAKQTKTLTIEVGPLSRSCNPSGRTLTYDYTSWAADPASVHGRGNFTIVVEQKAPDKKSPEDCKPPAKSDGDPHMRTHDGVSYDAQTLGEFWMVKPGPDGPDIEVQVRNETYAAHATIGTGLAARINGHTFEWYRNSDIAPQTKVKIDGENLLLNRGELIELGDGVTFTRSSSNTVWTVRTQGFALEVSTALSTREGRSALDLAIRVYADTGLDIAGVLGTPDGDPDNDFTTRDGLTTYTKEEIRLHGTALLDFWGSWRVTDLADSLFSETYPGFDQTISLFNPADLASKRAIAEEYLSHFDVICEVPTGSDWDYAIDRIAIEMLAGSDDDILDDNTCGYIVRGTVTTKLPGNQTEPVPGLTLDLGGDRLRDCRTITDANGRYSCRMIPVSIDDLPDEGMPPVEISINGSWKEGGATVMSDDVVFADFAELGGSDSMIEQDLTVDRSALVAAHVTGTLVADLDGRGLAPRSNPLQAAVHVFDGDGATIASFSEWVVPNEAGGYSFTRYMPGHAESIQVRYDLGSIVDDHPLLTFQVEPGTNSLNGDITFNPPLAVVEGTLTDVSGRLPDRVPVRIEPMFGGAGYSAATSQASIDENGYYRVVRQLSKNRVDTFEATVEVGVASVDWLVDRFTGQLVPGANVVDLSTVYDPPFLALSGTVLGDDGQPLSRLHNSGGVRIVSYDIRGDVIATTHATAVSDNDGGPGAYTADITLPAAAVRAEVRLEVGIVSGDWPMLEVDDLNPGLNEAVFDHVYSPPRLHLSGVLLDGDGGSRPTTRISLEAFDADDTRLTTWGTLVTPGEAGAYETDAMPLPIDTARVIATYEIGVNGSDWQSFEIRSIDPVLTEETIDIDHRYVRLVIQGVALGKDDVPLPLLAVVADAYDADGIRVGGVNRSHVIPRGDNGWYSLDEIMPDRTDHVVINVMIPGAYPADRPMTTLENMRAGFNQVFLDFTHVPTVVRVTGTMYGTRVDTGQPGRLAEQSQLDITAFDADGEVLASSPALPEHALLPFFIDAVTGAYYTDIVVPNNTDSVELRSRFGNVFPGVDDRLTMTVDGITYGEVTNVVFNDDYSPPVLKAHGNVKVAGVPYTGNVRVQGTVTLASGTQVQIPTSSWSFNPDSNGNYDFTRAFPRDAVSAELEFYPASAPSQGTTVVLDDLVAGWNEIQVDVDVDEFRVSIQGDLVFFDEPWTDPFPAVLHSYDTNGDEIEARAVTLHPDDGSTFDAGYFDETFGLTSGTRSVGISFEYVDADTGVVVPFSFGPRNVTEGVPNNFGSIGWGATNGSYVSLDLELTHDGDVYSGPVHVESTALYGEDREPSGSSRSSDVVAGPDGRVTVDVFLTSVDSWAGPLSAVGFELTDDDGHVLTYEVAAGRTQEFVHEDCIDGEWDWDLGEFICHATEIWTEIVAVRAIYTDTAALDFVTVHREVLIKADVDATVDFGFYRIPYSGAVTPDQQDHGFNDLGGRSVTGVWDADEGGYRFDLAVGPAVTHLAITATATGDPSNVVINHVVALDLGGTTVVEPTTGPVRLTMSGRSASTGDQADFGIPGCGFMDAPDRNFAGISRARIYMVAGATPPAMPVQEPGGDWSEYWDAYQAWLNWTPDPAISVAVAAEVWVIIDEFGNYSMPFDIDTEGYDWLAIELSNARYNDRGWGGVISDNLERDTVDLADHLGASTIDVTLDNRPTCMYPM